MKIEDRKVGERIEWLDYENVWQPGRVKVVGTRTCHLHLDNGKHVGHASMDRLRLPVLKFEDLKAGMEIDILACTGKWLPAVVSSVTLTERANGNNTREVKAQWSSQPNRWTVIVYDQMHLVRPRQAPAAVHVVTHGTVMVDMEQLNGMMQQLRRERDEAYAAKERAEQGCQRLRSENSLLSTERDGLANERDQAVARAAAAEKRLAEVTTAMADANLDLRAQLVSDHHKNRMRELKQGAAQVAASGTPYDPGSVAVKREWVVEVRNVLSEILLSIAGRE